MKRLEVMFAVVATLSDVDNPEAIVNTMAEEMSDRLREQHPTIDVTVEVEDWDVIK